jgi:hypothetical protein
MANNRLCNIKQYQKKLTGPLSKMGSYKLRRKMPSSCNDLPDYFFTIITERYESLGDDDKAEKNRLRKIIESAVSEDVGDLADFIVEHIETYETVSKDFMCAILGSIDYSELEEKLKEWLEDLSEDDEDPTPTCNECAEGSATYTCYECKDQFCKDCSTPCHIKDLDTLLKNGKVFKTFARLCESCSPIHPLDPIPDLDH